ncbi:hypothetical protein F4821DRAFT_251682 [Hypoxylon rubiginosum]|uniref:Uncharacterized protein n=1 Tax=Hypoxylon rubiginosum TaxID=110542 RepID=A0ACC0CIV8_9PEZI|nr:hypothetical protein F4821DRAFT_251682 [Hypoxylon rubiginosum]
MAAEAEVDNNLQGPKRTLRVDHIFKERDHQWHFVKTSNIPKKDRFSRYTLVVRRKINHVDGLPGDTKIEIRSPVLIDIFREILQGTKCNGLHQTPLVFSPEVLLLVLPPLLDRQVLEEAKEEPDQRMIEDIKEVATFVHTHFSDRKPEIESFHRNGEITYDHLWSLFPPGCVVI